MFPPHPTLIWVSEFERCLLWKINKKEWFGSHMVREKFPKLLCFAKIVCSPTLTFFLCFLIVPLIFFFAFLEGMVVPTSSNINLSAWIWALFFMKNQPKTMIWSLIWFVKNSPNVFFYRKYLHRTLNDFPQTSFWAFFWSNGSKMYSQTT